MNNIPDNNEILSKAVKLKRNKKGYLTYIARELGISEDEAIRVFEAYSNNRGNQEVLVTTESPKSEEIEKNTSEEEKDPTSGHQIHENSKYYYNKSSDIYVFPLKNGSMASISGWKHRSILKAYVDKQSNDKIDDLLVRFKLEKSFFDEYKRIFNITRDLQIPHTEEQLAEMTDEEVLAETAALRRLRLNQEANKRKWAEIEKDAALWNQYKDNVIDPFEDALSNYKPTPITLTLNPQPIKTTHTLLVGLSDIHFGAYANGEEITRGTDYDTKKAQQQIIDYAEKIIKMKRSRTYTFDKVVIASLGDILHSLTGKTTKGTELAYDIKGSDQFIAALDSLILFIRTLHSEFGKVEIHHVNGNHAGNDEYLLFTILEKMLVGEGIEFHINKTKVTKFFTRSSFIVMEHGNSDMVKFGGKVPNGPGAKKDSYILSYFKADNDIKPHKNKIFIQGDTHHFEHLDVKGIDTFVFGTMVTGDKYADHCNLESRPRQNALVLDDNGIAETLHFYFD